MFRRLAEACFSKVAIGAHSCGALSYRSGILLGMLLLAAVGQGRASAAEGVESYLAGLDSLERGDWAAAAAAFGAALESDDENADYQTARGVALALAERVPESRAALTRADRLRPNHPATRLWLASAVAMQGDFQNDVNFFPAATRDPYETAVREMSRQYGAPDFRRITLRQPVDPMDVASRRQAQSRFRSLARQFVARAKPQGADLGGALKKRGMARWKSGDFAGAAADLQVARRTAPDDLDLLFYLASSKRRIGAAEGARADFTRLLTRDHARAEAYLGRCLAHLQLGGVAQARADFGILRELSPELAVQHQAEYEQALRAAAPGASRAAQAAQFQALFEACRRGDPLEQLRAAALELARAAHSGRRRADETYQRELYSLRRAVDRAPKSAAAHAELGQFLFENAERVLLEWVEPRSDPTPYRDQSTTAQSLEFAEAETAVDRSLALDPEHDLALAFKGACLMKRQSWIEAERVLGRAIQRHPQSAIVLEMFARVLDHAARLKAAEAASLRATDVWSDWQYIYFRYPSKAELQLAAQYEAQARRLWALAEQSLRDAAARERGAARGFYYEAILTQRSGDLKRTQSALEEAVRIAPDYLAAWLRLIPTYVSLEMTEKSHVAQQIAANLTHTTAGPMLKAAWPQIERTALREAAASVNRALEDDPADPRGAAYLGLIAREREDLAAAAAWLTAAAVLSDAAAALEGATASADADTERLGRRSLFYLLAGELRGQLGDDAAAAELLQRNLTALAGVEAAERYRRLGKAMLPGVLQRAPETPLRPEAPNIETLEAWTRLRLARALRAAGRHAEAAAHLQWVIGFEQRKPAVLDVGSAIRVPAKLATIELVKVSLAMGDRESALQHLMNVGKPRFLTAEEVAELETAREQLGQRGPSGIRAREPTAARPAGLPPVAPPRRNFQLELLELKLTQMQQALRNSKLDETTRRIVEKREAELRALIEKTRNAPPP